MDLDAKVCYCFHVSRRKLLNFVRCKPKVPSQLSECGGAGTGCGWCIPFLKQIHPHASGGSDRTRNADTGGMSTPPHEYIRAGKGTPPPGASPCHWMEIQSRDAVSGLTALFLRLLRAQLIEESL